MSPVLGIVASGISGHLTPAYEPGAYYSLASVTVGAGGSSSIEFTNIPLGFKHLQIRGIATATAEGQMLMSFNGDTSSSNYTFHQIIGNGFNAISDGYATGTIGGVTPSMRFGASPYFGATVIDILDYSSSAKNKVTRSLLGADQNTTGSVQIVSGCWYNTSPINQIAFTVQGGGSVNQYTSFALYGVK